MHRLIPGAVAAAIFGAMAAGATVVLLFLRAPEIAFEMDRDLPRVISGFSPVERHLDDTFAWTSERAAIRLPDIDRFSSWRCVVRLRGGRPDHVPQPVVTIAADGVTLGRFAAVNEYRDFEVTVPVRPSPGLLLSITSSPTFVPGPSDQRSLGVQIDRLTCEPAAGSHPFPPWRVIGSAALAGAAFGAALFLLGLGLGGSLAGSTLFAMATAIPLATPPAAYDAVYLERATTLAIWISLLMLAPARVVALWRGRPLSPAASFVVAFTGGALFLQLAALLHPAKETVDALFHAHRFASVLGGQYFFTQPLRDGVSFPYAIGLYVASMPWSALTRDHVALLRIVVCAAAAIAAALIYPLVVTTWNDRRTAATAVVLCHFVPLPFVVFGNGNLTFAFGAAVTLAAVAAATAFPVSGAGVIAIAVLFALTSLALLSHVGIVPFLISLLVSAAVLYWWRGGPSLGLRARVIVAATVLAAVCSFGLYYGRFGEVYDRVGRTLGIPAANSPSDSEGEAASKDETTEARRTEAVSLGARAAGASGLAVRAYGIPIICLAILGLWTTLKQPGRDPLTLLLAGYGVVLLVMVGATVVAPIEARFVRYAAELIDRVYYLSAPAVVILAARGAMWTWRRGGPGRIASAMLLVWACAIALQYWLEWMR